MKKILLSLIYFIVISTGCMAKHIVPEKYYQNIWCRENGGEIEHMLPDGTRIDCLTEDFAVEFDFASKWAESIGQSLYYASKTSRRPGIVLIIEKNKDFKYYYRIKQLCNDYGISLWYMKRPKKVSGSIPQDNNPISTIVNFILNLFNEILKIFTGS